MDGWIAGRPIFVSRGFEYPERLGELDLPAFLSQWGWTPADVIVASAMCNGDQDHVLLGRLCVALATHVGGIIDLGGKPETMPPDVSHFPGAMVPLQVHDSGEAVPGGCDWVCDAKFLAHSIDHPAFRMVK